MTEEDRTPDHFDSRYRFERFLGSGGMAEVYIAHDEELGRRVAIKSWQPRYMEDRELVKWFKIDARKVANLKHQNIVSIYDWGEQNDGTHYIVMEYLPGGTLEDRIVKEGPLAPRTAVELTLQIAQALNHAHRVDRFHGDIKPQNIFLTEQEEAKVANFRIVGAAEQTPERDLYALGVALYEMLTGELPPHDTPTGTTAKDMNAQLRPPKEVNDLQVPKGINDVCMRLLAKDSNQRYPDVTALINDLERVKDNPGPITVPVPDLTGQKLARARELLAEVSLSLDDIQSQAPSKRVPEGGIAEQSPAAGAKVDSGSYVSVTISLGSIVEVPDLADLNRYEASKKLAEKDLRLGGRYEVLSDTVSKGKIVAQYPARGMNVRPGRSVITTVSSGPKVTTVPDVSGKSLEEAERILSNKRLNLESSPQTRVSLRQVGTVISTDPPVGSEVDVETSVTPMVSSGPPDSLPGEQQRPKPDRS